MQSCTLNSTHDRVTKKIKQGESLRSPPAAPNSAILHYVQVHVVNRAVKGWTLQVCMKRS